MLLKHVIGLLKPDSGQVLVDDVDITKLIDHDLNEIRKKFGMLFQEAALFDSMNVGGATVVNDLVFTSTYNGKIYAFNRTTGEQVYEYAAPGGINGWPAVSGDTIIFPVGIGQTPMLLGLKTGGTTAVPGGEIITPGSGKGFQQ